MKQITSRSNPLFRVLMDLSTSARTRRREGRVLLDGVHLVSAALDSGCVPEILALSESGAAREEVVRLAARASGVVPVVFRDALFREFSPSESPVGVAAVIARPVPLPDRSDCTLLLDRVQDPGNLGTVLRTGAAAGVGAVWLSPGCADAWGPRALRAGMGAHFVLAIRTDAELEQAIQVAGRRVIATVARNGQSLFATDLTGPVVIALGSEGAGLSGLLLEKAHERVTIPVTRVESLNVAAAAAVILFERVRQLTAA